jgi:hypothetical protein
MKNWADPVNYQPPEEVIRVIIFAVAFIALIYAARNPLAFGAVYLTYTVMNLFTMRHLRQETAEVIGKTREHLAQDPSDASMVIRGKAVNALESYFHQLLSPGRAWATLITAAAGLACAAYGAAKQSEAAQDIAYLIFILSVAIPELGLSWYWRSMLDRQLRPCEAALFELQRKPRARVP